MKIKERLFEQDGKIIHQRTNDYTQEVEDVKRIRDRGEGNGKDHKLVGRVPVALVYEWCQAAGVSMHDQYAVSEVIRKKMLDPDFKAFRVWEGSY